MCYIARIHVVQSKFTRWQYDLKWATINGDILILRIVGGWIRVRYLLHVYMAIPFHSPTFTAHKTTFLKLLRAEGQHGQTTIMLVYDELMRMCSQNTLDKFEKKLYKNTSQMKWKYFLHWRHALSPNDFQMHQQSIDHSYCKRENSLTKLNNSETVMILVVRLSSSPKRCFHEEAKLMLKSTIAICWDAKTREGFDVILVTPERVLVFQHRPDAEGLISILTCLKGKSYVLSLPGRVLVELPLIPRPSALRKRPYAFSLWNNNLGYQGILELTFKVDILLVLCLAYRGMLNLRVQLCTADPHLLCL
jgi:hypothetical protein